MLPEKNDRRAYTFYRDSIRTDFNRSRTHTGKEDRAIRNIRTSVRLMSIGCFSQIQVRENSDKTLRSSY